MDPLAAKVSASLRAHDPLDPWLTESAVDEHYWDGEAEEIARQLISGMDAREVRGVIDKVLRDLLGQSADGEAGLREQSHRLDQIADEIVGHLGVDT